MKADAWAGGVKGLEKCLHCIHPHNYKQIQKYTKTRIHKNMNTNTNINGVKKCLHCIQSHKTIHTIMQHMKTIHSIMQHMNNIKLNLSAVKGWQNVLNY